MKPSEGLLKRLCLLVSAQLYSTYALAISVDNATSKISELTNKKSEFQTVSDDSFFSVAQLMIFLVAVIAFLWVSYAAVSKFRECQSGRADWSELLVLGVAAAALLVFVGATVSTATDFLIN